MGFVRATKKASFLRMAISGPAGSGKTMTALKIAEHLGQRVAVIDTEHGSASKYADKYTFDANELDSFHPQNYTNAIKEAESGGYDVLIIDSLSHEWAGKDGALEQVDRIKKRSGNGFTAWGDVTPQHNELIEAMLTAKLHIIATIRSKEGHAQEKDDKTGKTVVRKLGMQPIQRDGVEYEFDIFGTLDYEHTLLISKSRCDEVDGKSYHKAGKEIALILQKWVSEGAPATEKPVVRSGAELLADHLEETAAAKDAAAKSVKYICVDCTQEIKGDAEHSDKEIAEGTARAYGVPVCVTCHAKRKKAAKAAAVGQG